mmetsp:Transcript_26048/g.61299  ORF Transcript_26048/g.61299 Transcript_26048/m.61299 type:complete len:299 (+) Transcript_26048:1655-2551(+)
MRLDLPIDVLPIQLILFLDQLFAGFGKQQLQHHEFGKFIKRNVQLGQEHAHIFFKLLHIESSIAVGIKNGHTDNGLVQGGVQTPFRVAPPQSKGQFLGANLAVAIIVHHVEEQFHFGLVRHVQEGIDKVQLGFQGGNLQFQFAPRGGDETGNGGRPLCRRVLILRGAKGRLRGLQGLRLRGGVEFGAVCGGQTGFQSRHLATAFQSQCVSLNRLVVLLERQMPGALATVTLVIIGLHANASVGILNGLFIFPDFHICCRSIGVECHISLFDCNGLRVGLDGRFPFPSLEGFVALIAKL